MSSINCINSSFYCLKKCIKNEFMDRMVKNIRLVWKWACMFRIHRTCNPTLEFSKYKFNNKLLDGITLFIITSSVTWTQLMYIRYFVLRSITYTIFSKQIHRWYIIIGSNLNLPIKVLFLPTNNNLPLIVCRHNISFLFLIDLGFLFLGIKLVFF